MLVIPQSNGSIAPTFNVIQMDYKLSLIHISCFFSAAVAMTLLFYAHLFGDIQILVLVDSLDQFRSHFRVDGDVYKRQGWGCPH